MMAVANFPREFWSSLTGGLRWVAVFAKESGLENNKKYAVKAATCGIMIATSALIPMASLPALGLGSYMKPVFGAWILSTAGFGALNSKPIIKYGPVMLALLPPTGLLIFLSPRPFSELPDWLPLCLATGLLLSVSVIPWAEGILNPERGPTLAQFVQQNGGERLSGSDAAINGQNSPLSVGTSNGRTRLSFLPRVPSWNLFHMGPSGNVQYRPVNAGNGSDIDLESLSRDGASRRESSDLPNY